MNNPPVPEPTKPAKAADPRKVRTRRIVIGGILLFIVVFMLIPVTNRVGARFTVVPLASEHVRAMTGGYLTEVRVKAGDRVVPGQILAVLDDEALRTNAEISRLTVIRLEAALASLSDPRQASEREKLRLDLERAREQAQSFAEQISNLVLRSTIEGIVLTDGMSSRAGDFIARGREVFQILEPGTVRLDLKLDEADVTRVRIGHTADIHFRALPGERYTGRVSAVVPLHDVTEPEPGKRAKAPARDFRAYIDIVNPREAIGAEPATLAAGASILGGDGEATVLSLGRFRPGMSGDAYIAVGSRTLGQHIWATIRGMLRSDLLFF